jgi:hypothetical protein
MRYEAEIYEREAADLPTAAKVCCGLDKVSIQWTGSKQQAEETNVRTL